MKQTDTPRTDAAYKNHEWDLMDHIPLEFARQLERELAISLANELKTQAELSMLRAAYHSNEIDKLKAMVKKAAFLGDARCCNFKDRAEKAESLLTQIQAFTVTQL